LLNNGRLGHFMAMSIILGGCIFDDKGLEMFPAEDKSAQPMSSSTT
jgi:hypothetical protein